MQDSHVLNSNSGPNLEQILPRTCRSHKGIDPILPQNREFLIQLQGSLVKSIYCLLPREPWLSYPVGQSREWLVSVTVQTKLSLLFSISTGCARACVRPHWSFSYSSL